MPGSTYNFPHQATPFIGREEELTAIKKIIANPACQMLTIVGPGGIGKTRLAVQACQQWAETSEIETYFVDLQPVNTESHLVSTVVDTLGIPLSGIEAPGVQLLNYLRNKKMLLVLDSFEHLLHGVDLIIQFLQNAPELKLVVTSREAFGTQEEWLYPVDGMLYPAMETEDDINRYEAVEFFIKCVQRVNPDFSLQAEKEGVIKICQLVKGMPLALEIAASWTKTLQCNDIAVEIQKDIEFLTSSLRNVPARHRSIQAVFDQSWKRLDVESCKVLKRLSVFKGGFDRQAAIEVAQARLPVLAALVNQSLLRVEPGGRYRFHGLIRQLVEDKLRENKVEVTQIHDLHCAYFANFLQERFDGILGGKQIEAAQDIDVEIQNIRSAWGWAVDNARLEEIIKSAQTLITFLQFRSRYLEGCEALEKARQCINPDDRSEIAELARANISIMLGWGYLRFGQLEQSMAAALEIGAVYNRLGIPPIKGDGTDPDIILGIIASIKGDYDEVMRLGKKVLEKSEEQGHLWNHKYGYYLLTGAALALGQYERAHALASKAYRISREIVDTWFSAYPLIDIGKAALGLGDYVSAKEHFEASYAIREQFRDPEGMALALSHLGEIELLQGDFKAAQQNYQRSHKIYREINDKGGLASTHKGLGDCALAIDDYRSSSEHYLQALCIARDIQYTPLSISLLIGIGELLWKIGRGERGMELFLVASEDPASEHETKERARRAVTAHKAHLSAEQFAAASEKTMRSSISEFIETLVAELPVLNLAETIKTAASTVQVNVQPLIEPLTERELEVMRLIANGLTNKQIAETLIISTGTTKWYTSNIYSKLGVNNRTQAVAHAREIGLIE